MNKLPRGEKHWRAKLTEADVIRMRKLRGDGWSYGQLSLEFRIVPSAVACIVNGQGLEAHTTE